jgi:hypothetical protein
MDEAMHTLQTLADGSQGLVIAIGIVDGKCLGVDLVDGHMDVQVVGVGVHRAHALMLAETQCVADFILDAAQNLKRRLFACGKRDQEVIGLVAAGALVP